jgi:hypothetical protein
VAEGAGDEDRCRTRLLADLAAVREAGGAGQYEFFRAVGRARASLAGKQTRPSDGRPGMVAIRRTGEKEPVRGKGEVLRVIHEESQAMHQDHGASPAAALEVVRRMEGWGLPLCAPRAVLDVREECERHTAWEENRTAHTAAAEAASEWTQWRTTCADTAAMEALTAAEYCIWYEEEISHFPY